MDSYSTSVTSSTVNHFICATKKALTDVASQHQAGRFDNAGVLWAMTGLMWLFSVLPLAKFALQKLAADHQFLWLVPIVACFCWLAFTWLFASYHCIGL